MPVERVDYLSDEEYFRAAAESAVVPCHNCGNPMYQVHDIPQQNICDDCYEKHYKEIERIKKDWQDIGSYKKVEDIPF